MRPFETTVLLGMSAVFFFAGIALAQGGGQGNGGQGAGPSMRCEQRFDAMDTSKDGRVSQEEFLAAPHRRDNPEQRFKAMDVEGRGYLTKDVFCAGKGMGRGKGMGQGQGAGVNQ